MCLLPAAAGGCADQAQVLGEGVVDGGLLGQEVELLGAAHDRALRQEAQVTSPDSVTVT